MRWFLYINKFYLFLLKPSLNFCSDSSQTSNNFGGVKELPTVVRYPAQHQLEHRSKPNGVHFPSVSVATVTQTHHHHHHTQPIQNHHQKQNNNVGSTSTGSSFVVKNRTHCQHISSHHPKTDTTASRGADMRHLTAPPSILVPHRTQVNNNSYFFKI